MRIIIVGCGKTGYSVAKILSAEKDVHVTVVDNNPGIFDHASSSIDVKFVSGNGLTEKTLNEAGAKDADLIIAVTGADEVNILCGIMAEHLGTKHSVARVRNPEYALEFNKLWQDLGIDMVINPEHQTAREISRLLRHPTVDGIDTFIGGRIELVSFKVSEAPEFFAGKKVSQIFNKKMGILFAVVERGSMAIIPNGDFVFENADVVRILGRPSSVMGFFALLEKKRRYIHEVVIIGGGKITHYLTELLHRHTKKARIKIIEKDREKCEELCQALCMDNHRCMILHGDGTNEDVLLDADIGTADAVICLSGRDEENAIIALYARQVGVRKVITKVNHIQQNMIKNIGLGTVINPQSIASDSVVRYVRGLLGAQGRNIRTMYKIFSGTDGNVEIVEFIVNKKARCLDTPLKDLRLRKEMLIGCIVRGSEVIIPSGETRMQMGDNVVIIAKNVDIHELDDILSA